MAAQSFLLQNPNLFQHPPPPQSRPSHTCSSVNFKNIPTKSFKNLIVNNSVLLNNNNNNNRRSNNGDSNNNGIKNIRFAKLEIEPSISTVTVNSDNAQFSPIPPLRRSRRAISTPGRRIQKFRFGGYYLAPAVCAPAVRAVPPALVDVAVSIMEASGLLLATLITFFLPLCLVFAVTFSIFKAVTVIKLQVGLLGSAKSLQKDINRIAETADASTTEGLHNILTDFVLALLRHPEHCISVFLSIDVKWSTEGAEQRFYQLSLEERSKFDEETLVNFNNAKSGSSCTLRSSGFSNEYIVVTILVRVIGKLKLPRINNIKDLKEVLEKLGSLPLCKIAAVEVLLAPRIGDDTLSEEKLLENYPLLRPLH
ncbi:hypothetical protein ABFX02_14G185100 [Erythranthe guttata]